MKKTLALAGFALTLNAAVAQHTSSDLSNIERRIAALEAAHSIPAESALHATWGPGLQLATEDKSIRLRIGGRIQQDWSLFSDADRALIEDVGALDDTVDFRRIWFEMDGTFYDRTIFAFYVDFAGGRTSVRSMFVGLKHIPYFGTVRVGSQQEPFGLEELTVNNNLTFLERALDIFYPSYNVGVLAQRGFVNRRMSLSYGAFRETDDSGRLVSGDGYSFTARLTGLPMASDDGRRLIHLGIAASHRTTPHGRVDYRGRPVNRWAPPFVVATNIAADEERLAGLEAAVVWGSLSVQSEWSMAAPDTEGNDPEFSAYYVQASYFLTREHRQYIKANGCFGAITPKRPLGEGGWGAWEFACRLSNLDLTDGLLDGGELRNLTAGLNWYPNSVARVMLNFVRSDLDGVGEADAVLARFQIAF